MSRRPAYFFQGKSLRAYCKDRFGGIVLPDDFQAFVYSIKNVRNGKLYIGHSSQKPYERWYDHFLRLQQQCHHSAHLQGSWNKHGFEAFEFSVIEFCPHDSKIAREQFWMDLVKPVYNTVKSAKSTLGYKHTSETRKSISERARRDGYAQNFLHTEEAQRRHKEVMSSVEYSVMRSKILKGHKKKEGSRENYIAASSRRKASGYKLVHSPESRAKMSLSHKGKKKTPEHVAAIKAAKAKAKLARSIGEFKL